MNEKAKAIDAVWDSMQRNFKEFSPIECLGLLEIYKASFINKINQRRIKEDGTKRKA